MKKKILSVLLAGAMVSSLVACGVSTGEETTGTSDASSETTETAASGDAIVLLNGKPEIDEQLQALAAAYTAESGQAVEIQTVGGSNSATASDTLKKDYQAGTMPDIFVAEANQFANWEGMLADMSGEAWTENTELEYVNEDGTVGFPYMVEAWGIGYNADILEAAGVDPSTLTSPAGYKAAFETLESKKDELGLTAVVDYGANATELGWSTGTHMFGQYLDAGLSAGADSEWFDLLQDGGKIDADRMTQFAEFIDLIQQHCDETIATTGNYDQETALFAQGKAAFITQGSWFGANLTGSDDYSGFKCGIAPFAFADGIDTICGGATSYWAVYADGNVDAAKAFLQWCSEETAQKAFVNECGFVSPFNTVSDIPSDPFAEAVNTYKSNGKLSPMHTFEKKDGLQNDTSVVFEDFAKGNLDVAGFVETISKVCEAYYAQ